MPGGWLEVVAGHDDRDRGHARDGRFTLHGLEPDVEVPAFFLEPERKLGATCPVLGQVRGERPGHGPARALRHGAGRGSSGPTASRSPGSRRAPSPRWSSPPGRRPREARRRTDPLFAEEAIRGQARPGQLRAANSGRTPRAGLTFPALIPAPYRIVDHTPAFDGGEPAIRKEFTVKPGETIDLGDILIDQARKEGR